MDLSHWRIHLYVYTSNSFINNCLTKRSHFLQEKLNGLKHALNMINARYSISVERMREIIKVYADPTKVIRADVSIDIEDTNRMSQEQSVANAMKKIEDRITALKEEDEEKNE